jgi:hypothetical protein
VYITKSLPYYQNSQWILPQEDSESLDDMQQKLLSATSPYETFVLNLKGKGAGKKNENTVGKERDAALTRYTRDFTNKFIEKQSQSQSQHQQPQSQQEQHQSHQQDKADGSFLGNTTTLTSLSSVVQSPQNLSFSPISTNSEHYLHDNSNTTMMSMELTDSHHTMETLMNVETSFNTVTDLNLPSSQANASMQEEKLPQSLQNYIFSCYLQDLQHDFTFPNTDLIENAKPCQFLRAQNLHYVQCLQSFLYVVYRRDPGTIDIPFLKVRANVVAIHSFIRFHVCVYFYYY